MSNVLTPFLPIHALLSNRAGRAGILGIGLLLLLAGLWFVVPTPQSAVGIEKIVAGGDPTPIGGVFATDGTPAIGLGVTQPHDMQKIAFFAHVDGGSQRMGIFQIVGNQMTTIAAVGEPTPLGGTFAVLSPPAQNRTGDVAFTATIAGGDAPQGVFLFANGQLSTMAKLGGEFTVEGLPSHPIVPAVNYRGEVTFWALFSEAEGDIPGIFMASQNGVEPLVMAGDLTETGEEVAIDQSDTLPIAFNAGGDVAMSVRIKGNTEAPGIFMASQTHGLRRVVSVGEPTPLGGTFALLNRPAINEAGAVAFSASVTGGSAAQGIFLASQTNQLSVVAAEGDPTPAGGHFAVLGLTPPPVMNANGTIAFSALVIPDDGGAPLPGLFVARHGQLRKAVLTGDPSPLGGTFLGGMLTFHLSDTGDVVFIGSVDTDGDGTPDNQGIFSVRP